MKVDFIDFWPNFMKEDNYFFHLLSLEHDVEIDEQDPDVVFMSCYSMHKQRYANHRCKKIFFSGENRGLQSVVGGRWADTDFKYDLTLTFDATEGNNVYLPLFVLFINWFRVPIIPERDISFLADLPGLLEPLKDPEGLLRTKKQGCCFLAKNPTAELRNSFCQEAQKHISVHCAGPVLNNYPQIGGRGDQVEKINFIMRYRSIIAFENSRHSGYLTEKALHGFATRCVPVYWGANEAIQRYFNDNYIAVGDDWEEPLRHLKQICESDDAYLEMVTNPPMKRTVLDEFSPQRILAQLL